MSAQPPATSSETPVVPPIRAPLVLVADDSAEMRELIREVLVREGYEVITVGSGGRALREMSNRRPDLVITDLLMPGMSGFSLRTLMLRRADLADIPVIVLSAYWHRPSETLDVAEVLTKPISTDRLIASVRRSTGGVGELPLP
jgi:CheY-like chemotaxis protein